MDGEHAANDDVAPAMAEMLRPYCAAPGFVEAWEQAKQVPPGTVRATLAKSLSPSGTPEA